MLEDDLLLAVGTVKGLTFYPRHVDGKEAPQYVALDWLEQPPS
jgi:hypothetical protein